MCLVLAAIGSTIAARTDVAGRGGGVKGDEATYVGLASSIGFDGDVRFDAEDYRRFQAWYGGGPEGIFLKRGVDGALYFGKAYVYGLLAAPFARAGDLGGLFAFNVLCLAVVIVAGAWWLAADAGRSLGFSAAFVVASVAPLYAFWLTSEVLNYTLVFLAFVAGVPRERDSSPSRLALIASAICLGAAIFSKPLNLPLSVPLAIAIGGGINKRAAASLTLTGLAVVAFFAVNFAMTGELNYQGGERKTFYGQFPFDVDGHSFETTGIGMATNSVEQPIGQEGRFAPLAANIGYFIAGRHFGLIPFGWPWLVTIALWTVGERRKALWQWATLGALAFTAVVTLIWMPYTWSGGGGPVGNRYFLSLGAASFFLVPEIGSWLPAALAALGLVFVGPSLAAPFTVAKQPWLASRSAPFALLPVELTGASDFPVILDQRRGRIPQGREPALFVALMDDAAGMGRNGWMAVAAHAGASLLVRAPEPLHSVTVGIKAPQACDVILTSSGRPMAVALGTGDRKDVEIAPAQTYSRDSFVFVLDVDASACDAAVEVALQGHRQSPH